MVGDMWLWIIRLFQVKMEREHYQTEIRDLQDQLSEMHDELDSAKKSAADEERDAIMVVRIRVNLNAANVVIGWSLNVRKGHI